MLTDGKETRKIPKNIIKKFICLKKLKLIEYEMSHLFDHVSRERMY